MADNETIPPEDLEMLSLVAQFAKEMIRQQGSLAPIAAFLSNSKKDGRDFDVVQLPGLGGSQDDKRAAISIVQVLSVGLNASVAVIAFESWGVRFDVEGVRKLKEQGRSLSEHPDAEEAIYLVAESAAGRTSHTLTIERGGDDALILREDEEPMFERWKPLGMQSGGNLTNFFVPLAIRDTPAVLQWVEKTNQMFGDPIGNIKAGQTRH